MNRFIFNIMAVLILITSCEREESNEKDQNFNNDIYVESLDCSSLASGLLKSNEEKVKNLLDDILKEMLAFPETNDEYGHKEKFEVITNILENEKFQPSHSHSPFHASYSLCLRGRSQS